MYYRNCNCYNNSNTKNDGTLEKMCDCVDNMTSYYDSSDCSCGFDEEESLFPSNPMFGQSYVPIQTLNKTFIPRVGLKMGTIFPELVSPYMPCQSMREIEYLEATNPVKEGCNK